MTYRHCRSASVFPDTYRKQLTNRLTAKVRAVGDCWLFDGADDGRGYKKIAVRYIEGYPQLKAHVLSFILFRGDVPARTDVAHKCNHKACVNPEHLYLASRSVNVMHAIRDGLQSSRLNDDQVREIRASYQVGDVTQSALAQRFAVDQSIVSRIVLGKAFRWVT